MKAPEVKSETADWHELADRTRCQAASQRADGECSWRHCPAKDGVCPLHREEYDD